VPGGLGTKHTRSGSRGTASNAVPEATYDLEVFHNGVVGDNADLSRSRSSLHADTLVNEDSPGGATTVSRNPSNRVARKPPPAYVEGEDATLPKGAVSKPPVAGKAMGHVRSYSRTNSRHSVESGSVDSRELSHKGSTRFYGEKEGPVHYLIPDFPSPPSS